MHPQTYRAFRDELEKIALNAQKIREQGQQMIMQGQMMVQDPLKASSQIQQTARQVANNPTATPQQAANSLALKAAVTPTVGQA
jgi:hypothetical protein